MKNCLVIITVYKCGERSGPRGVSVRAAPCYSAVVSETHDRLPFDSTSSTIATMHPVFCGVEFSEFFQIEEAFFGWVQFLLYSYAQHIRLDISRSPAE
jgi:hypothetical protein